MGKTGSWMHSIKKAIRNHVHGDLDRNKFQHLAHDKKPSSDQRTCSTASSHVEHDSHRRPSTSSQVGGSGHHEHSLPKVEKGRSSTSSQVAHHNEKSTKSDKDKRRSSTSSQNGGSGHYEKDDSCQHGSGHHNYVTDHYDRKSSHRSENGSGHHKEESSTPRDRSDRENGSRQHRDDRSSHSEREGRKSSSHHRDEKGNGHRTDEKSSSSHRDERERGKDDYGAGADYSHLQRDERDRYVKLQLHRDGSGEHQHLAKLHREGSGDHQHLVKVYTDERGTGGGGQNPFYEKGRSSTSSERRYGFREESASDRGAPRHSTHSDRGGERSHEEEKGRSSTSSQKERSSSRHGHRDHERDHEKPPVEKGRSSTSTSSTHNERTILEKARSSTSSNHPRDANSSSEKGRPCTPSSPDNRTRSLLISIETPSPSEKRRSSSGAGAASPRHQHQHAGAASPRHHQVIDKASSEKLRPKTPSSPPMVVLGKTQSDKSSSRSAPVPAAGSNSREIPHQQLLEKSHRSTPTPTPSTAQLGRSIALQDLLKPPSFERKSSSSSSMSLSQVGGSMRSFTSEVSISSSDDYVELVFPQAETRPAAAPQVKTTPPPPPPSISASQNHNQRKKVAIATVKEVFSLHEYDVPLSPGAQRRKSASFTPKTLPELGTKSLLPPDYRKQQPALAVADMPAVIFKAGDAGVGGMLGEWAAITIQSSWRGFAARVAFNALKGLVRLQALVRGHLVRRKIAPLIKARIQAARVRIKLNRNPKVHNLHPIHISKSNGYGIAQTVFETRTSSQYGFAQPVLDDSPTITRGHSGPRDTLKAFM